MQQNKNHIYLWAFLHTAVYIACIVKKIVIALHCGMKTINDFHFDQFLRGFQGCGYEPVNCQ